MTAKLEVGRHTKLGLTHKTEAAQSSTPNHDGCLNDCNIGPRIQYGDFLQGNNN